MKQQKKKAPPCKDAFLYNPVASVQDCTGYSPYKSATEEEAISRGQLCDVPATSADGGEAVPLSRQILQINEAAFYLRRQPRITALGSPII